MEVCATSATSGADVVHARTQSGLLSESSSAPFAFVGARIRRKHASGAVASSFLLILTAPTTTSAAASLCVCAFVSRGASGEDADAEETDEKEEREGRVEEEATISTQGAT